MEVPLLIVLVLLLVVPYQWAQGAEVAPSRDENFVMKRRLELINKPTKKSFVHGDILDCVEIYKQLAFDHPLLKNHSIQMETNFKIPKRTRLNGNSSSILTVSQLLPKNMRCPKGTVLIKRIQEEDLMMEKYSKLLGMTFPTSNFSDLANTNDAPQLHNEIAALVTTTPNSGAAGMINLWSPEVKPDQFSDACFFVRNDDGLFANAIMTGWAVNPFLYSDSTRLYAYWTRDNGQSTGCYNTLCPGFVQISQKVTLGQNLSPISKRLGEQYFVDLSIIQDVKTKNWFLLYGEERVGYWPKELFTTLANGATKAGWGGEIQSPISESPPGMGSGRFSKENFTRACLMKWLQLRAPQGFPAEKDLQYFMTKPKCYDIWYGISNDQSAHWGHFIYFGGPPGCSF